MRPLLLSVLLSWANLSNAQDWPQACYNETSMWVTNACKTYIEEVYIPEQETLAAAPAPAFGSGAGALVVAGGAVVIVLWRRRRWMERGRNGS